MEMKFQPSIKRSGNHRYLPRGQKLVTYIIGTRYHLKEVIRRAGIDLNSSDTNNARG